MRNLYLTLALISFMFLLHPLPLAQLKQHRHQQPDNYAAVSRENRKIAGFPLFSHLQNCICSFLCERCSIFGLWISR